MSMPRRSTLKMAGLLGLGLGISDKNQASADDPIDVKPMPLDSLWSELEKDEESASRALLKLADRRKEVVHQPVLIGFYKPEAQAKVL